MVPFTCSACGAQTLYPEDPARHSADCANMRALQKHQAHQAEPLPAKEPRFTLTIDSVESSEHVSIHLTIFELAALVDCCHAMLHHDISHVTSCGTSIARFDVYKKS